MKEIEIKYKESRRRARLNWAHSEHGKELTKNYMKDYRRLPHNKEKAHEYYVKNKAHWGEITKAKKKIGEVYDRKMKTLKHFMKSGLEKMVTEIMIY